MIFNLHFPNANEDEHIFMYIFLIYVAFFIKYLFKYFTHFLLGYFIIINFF